MIRLKFSMGNTDKCFWCEGKPPNKEEGTMALKVLQELGEAIK